MKKLVFLLTAVFLTAISVNVFAQGTGIHPAVGSTHAYSVANNASSSYVWTVTTTADGSGTDLLIAGTVVSGSSILNTIDLTWNNLSIGNSYYVHIVETGVNSCTNHKVLAVEPKNQFEMDIANVDNAEGGLVTNFSTCAPAVTNISWNGSSPVTAGNATDFSYDYGTVTFYYKVTATGIASTDWVPVFTINHNSAGSVTAEWATTIGGSYTTGLATDSSVNSFTVTGTAAGTADVFFVKVIVVLGTADEGLTARDIEIDLDELESKDEYDNVVTSTNTDTIDQTINQRPSTGVITY